MAGAADGGSSFDAALRLFEEVCDLPEAELGEALAAACGGDQALAREVLELVASDRGSQVFDAPPPGTDELFAAAPRGRVAVPGFALGEPLGAGGMGVVYEAEQLSPRRRVALKLLRPGLVTAERLRRFELEAQALGWLDHPGIARIWASGTTVGPAGGQPWLAMELVRGERIDRWVAAREPSLEERLELLARVCDAVDHAHRRGIVHRDLKPANVLVDADGNPKVLDFGLARIGGPSPAPAAEGEPPTRHTATGELLGTVAAMSPEQLSGDPSAVDQRADVWALGVIAYQVLAGAPPLELAGLSLPEAARRILHEEPARLGRRDPRLAGDVEVIVATALAKDKARRYATAAELAGDLRRFLASEPILARPASRAYRARKFVRRNRLFVGVSAAVFLVLSAGTVASTTLFLRVRAEAGRNAALADDHRREAERQEELGERYRRESRTAGEALFFLERIFEASSPFQSRVPTARELIDRSAERIAGEFQGDDAVRGRLLRVLGQAYVGLVMSDKGLPLLEEALELVRAEYGEDGLEYARTLHQLANADEGRPSAERAADLRRVLACYRRELGEESDDVATAMNDLAVMLSWTGSPDDRREAIALYRESARIHALHWGADHRRTEPARVNLAYLLLSEGRPLEGEEVLREVLERSENPAARANALAALGDNLTVQLRFDEAQEALGQALELGRRRFGAQSLFSLRMRGALANVEAQNGKEEQGFESLMELAAEAEARLGRNAPLTLSTLHDLAACMAERPDGREDALLLYQDLLERARSCGDKDLLVFQILHNLSFLFSDLGRLEEAEAAARDAWRGRIGTVGEESPVTILSGKALASVLRGRGKLDEALALRRRLLAASRRTFGPGGEVTGQLRGELAALLRQMGREAEAAAVERGEPAPAGVAPGGSGSR